MPEINLFSEVAQEIGNELLQAQRDAAKSKAIEFGQQRVSKVKDLEQRARTSREAEQALFARPDGKERILKMLRAKRGQQ